VGVCAHCGQESPGAFRFCGACGSPLTQGGAEQIARKTVTVLFADIRGSTELGETLDPEAFRAVMQGYYDAVRGVVDYHGGTVAKFIGDAVMAVFGIPLAHEDDAVRAVRAAAEIRSRMPSVGGALGVALEVRTGINTGLVAAGATADTLALGDAVNVAARLEQAAAPGDILLGPQTLDLVRDAVVVERLEPLILKGKAGPVSVSRLLSVDPRAAGLARRFDTPFVGREMELATLRQAYDEAVGQRRCQALTLLGEAGVGKSRLVAESLRELGNAATLLSGRCLHYGEGITFWPIAEALRTLGPKAEHVLQRLDRGAVAAPQEIFFDVRRVFEEVAGARPLVVLLDDLQWAQPMLLDLLDHVWELSRDAPIVLLCVARTEFWDGRLGGADGAPRSTTVTVGPLATPEARDLLHRLDAPGLDRRAQDRLIAACGGNPLFLEEMARGAGRGESDAAPAGIQALLAARLEHLPEREQALLQRGAVEGEVFHRAAVEFSSPDTTQSQTDAVLGALLQKGLIRVDGSHLPGEQAFRFHHLLLRDAAYEGLAKATRAELHERFASWLERVGAPLAELDEISGWHLEQAASYCGELGLRGRIDLASRSAGHLADAGRRASARQDFAAASNLLTRALAQLSAGRPGRGAIALELADVLVQSADYERVEQLLVEASSDPAVAPYATLVRTGVLVEISPKDGGRAVRQQVPAILERFRRAGDDRGLARAHLALFQAHWLGSRAEPSAAELRNAIAAAERGDQPHLRARALMLMAGPIVFGPMGPEAMRQELLRLEAADAGPVVAVGTEFVLAALARMEGSFDDARRHCKRAGEIARDLGMPGFAAGNGQMAGEIEMSAGRPAAAATVLRDANQKLEKFGEEATRSTILIRLAGALLELGDLVGGERRAIEGEDLSADEDVINFAQGRCVRALVMARRGELARAESLAEAAVSYAFETDFPTVQAEANLALANVIAARGRRRAARELATQALEACERKGDQPLASRARQLAATLR
jgi:class 3 adenylate cyclase